MRNLNDRVPLGREQGGEWLKRERDHKPCLLGIQNKHIKIPQPKSKEKCFLLGSTEPKKNKYRIINPFSNPQHSLLSKGNVDGPNVSLASLLFLFLFLFLFTQKLTDLSPLHGSLMAMKHRKLFPTQTSTNQSVDCLEVCDSTCPYNCYIYPDSLIPPPPPASQPPPTLSTLDRNDSPNISPYVIITVGLLVGFFLLVGYYAIIVKYCSGWRRRNRSPPSESDGGDEEFLDENRGPAVDHPIWFITTVGLQQAIINSITVCKYKRGEGLIEGTECSVCLSEFQEDETLRLLPKCNHAFHIPCIDRWLRSHTNCPLCRARIISDTVNPPLESIDQNSHSLGPNEQTQMENSGNDTELGNNLVRSSGVYENAVGRVGTGELQILDDERTSKEGVNSNGDAVLQVNGNSANNHVVDSEIQPVRRSVSMDSSSAATIFVGLANFHADESKENGIDETRDGRNFDSGSVPKRDVAYTRTFRQMGSPSIAQ